MPYPTPEQERASDHANPRPPSERVDEVVLPAMEPGDDPKGWNRASITLFTHPLHPRPRLTQDDLLWPSHTDRLRALGDAAIFAACIIGLAFFPLYIAYIVLPGLPHVYWLSALGAGLAGGLWAFFRMVSITPEEYLESYEPS
jgi:hypothetical protein